MHLLSMGVKLARRDRDSYLLDIRDLGIKGEARSGGANGHSKLAVAFIPAQ